MLLVEQISLRRSGFKASQIAILRDKADECVSCSK